VPGFRKMKGVLSFLLVCLLVVSSGTSLDLRNGCCHAGNLILFHAKLVPVTWYIYIYTNYT
jgi:hypothetical protein